MDFTAEAIETYLQNKQRAGVSAKTISSYRTPLYHLLTWLGDDAVLTTETLQQWRKQLEQAGYSKYTVQGYVKAINSYLKAQSTSNLHIPRPLANNLTGQTFGYLTVLGVADERHKRNIMWQCQCQCGNITQVSTAQLLSGRTTSCGCLKTEILLHNNRYVEGTELRQALRDESLNSNNSSGYTGVQPKGSKWIAYITYKKKKYHLGTFHNLDDAIKARARAKELVMEDAKRLYEQTSDLFQQKPGKPPKPKKQAEKPQHK